MTRKDTERMVVFGRGTEWVDKRFVDLGMPWLLVSLALNNEAPLVYPGALSLLLTS